MLRVTEVKLPLDHPEAAIRAAILQRLGIAENEFIGYSIFRRAVDARKPAIALTYTLDVEVKDELALLERLTVDRPCPRAPKQTIASWRGRRQVCAHGPS